MRLNAFFYKSFWSPRNKQSVKVHLGPGQEKYINGWINVDSNIFTAKIDVWADLKNPLPFSNETVDCFYSHHMVEHLPDIERHFCEVYRCLKPGGVYRVAGPNGDSAAQKLTANDFAWFEQHSHFPEDRSSIGGKLNNFLMCKGEHVHVLTLSFLTELLISTGFIDIFLCKPVQETYYPAFFQECLATENESDFDTPHTIVVEAYKPLINAQTKL